MTIDELLNLPVDKVKERYNLTDNNMEYIEADAHYLVYQKYVHEHSKKAGFFNSKLERKINYGVDYNIYKHCKSKHFELWSGYISREAYREYYMALLENRKPQVTAEHYWNRARVIHMLYNEGYCDFIEKHGMIGWIYLYFENPGFGKFHITTSLENHYLKNQQKYYDLTWREQYDNCDIELFESYVDSNYFGNFDVQCPMIGLFDLKSQSFWQKPNFDELMEEIEEHEIDISDINKEWNIKIIA